MEVEGCLGCLDCVKRSSCIYQVYDKRKFDPASIVDSGDNLCISCLRCVQECKKGILSRALNPAFEQMGDDYWTPDLIARIYKQAETGKIPVSGAGYRGPFTGPGFDQMWTDMSEIVRPTRDGIHGREYISTIIELGSKPARLDLDLDGRLQSELPPVREIAIPIILEFPTFGMMSDPVRSGFAAAAAGLETLAVATGAEAVGNLADHRNRLIVKFDPKRDRIEQLEGVSILELAYGNDVLKQAAALKAKAPGLIVSVRSGRFITGLMREVHLKLVEAGLRDRVTMLISGGIALAEHVPKILICGADGVGVDLALLAALECRLCQDCVEPCPVAMKDAPADWVAQRIVNLIGSWHAQFIEVMGAMGLREARRLRGEMGRAMFFEDLERENFMPLFGERISEVEPDGKDCPTPEAEPLPLARKYPPVSGLASPCPSRYRNQLGKYKVVRTSACAACGKCAGSCAYGVHRIAGKRMLSPRSHLCVGPEVCRGQGACCRDLCPERALRVGLDPLWKTFGDPRWPAELLAATWHQAETGRPPDHGFEYRTGASGGGFDRMDFIIPEQPPDPSLDPREIDLSIPLNRRGDGRPQVTIGFPIYGGGMSFGSISLAAMLSRARAYRAFNSFTCTGE
jgi:ferredoxin